ncbi:MAG: hypothetical protein PWP23_926 [Candidatus Sumerlaeota bacterium]|nr:hypothetical protein [Candidatus Sumerlaeota bacterium]
MAKQAKQPVNDLVLVLFSLLLAFLVWAIVRQQEILTQTILVPIDYRNLPPYVELDPSEPFTPTQIPVSFSFPKGEERMVGSAEFRLRIDLADMGTRVGSTERYTEYVVRVTRENLKAPDKLSFVEYRSEPEVTFRARLRVARATVVPRLGPEPPAEGYRIETDAIRAEPSEIDVAVDLFHYELAQRETIEIPTEEISVAGARTSLRRVAGLLYNTSDGVYPMPSNPTSTVTVFVPIPEIEVERSFPKVPIRYKPIKRRIGATLSPEFASITVSGPVSQLDRMSSATILLTPRPNEFLDEETAGESFETLIDASFDGIDPELRDRLRATIEPRFVRVRFYAKEPETPIETPTPSLEPEPTPLPVVRRDDRSTTRLLTPPVIVPARTPQPTPSPSPNSPAPRRTPVSIPEPTLRPAAVSPADTPTSP